MRGGHSIDEARFDGEPSDLRDPGAWGVQRLHTFLMPSCSSKFQRICWSTIACRHMQNINAQLLNVDLAFWLKTEIGVPHQFQNRRSVKD